MWVVFAWHGIDSDSLCVYIPAFISGTDSDCIHVIRTDQIEQFVCLRDDSGRNGQRENLYLSARRLILEFDAILMTHFPA